MPRATGAPSRQRLITLRALCLAGAATAALAFGGGAAEAGQCPADKVVANSNLPNAQTTPRGVADSVLGHIDLSREAVHADGYQLRLRRLVVQPGGVVPYHDHAKRPAIIYIVEGEITEYANTCAVPITHRAGEVAMESRGLAHWWRNNGSRPAVLLSADIFPPQDDPHMM